MKNIFLSLGSNRGDRISYLEKALKLLEHHGVHILHKSSIWETEPVGKKEQPEFLNMVVEVQTVLSPQQLMETILVIEKTLGRVRGERWGARTLDIDIILYGSQMVEEDKLQIPHPRFHQRRFVLVPLLEIVPDFVHPLTKQSGKDFLSGCLEAKVKKYRGKSGVRSSSS